MQRSTEGEPPRFPRSMIPSPTGSVRRYPCGVTAIDYALEHLYLDQDHDWVVDAIPAVLVWVPDATDADARSFVFDVAFTPIAKRRAQPVQLALQWDLNKLAERDPEVRSKAERYRRGRTVHREHLAETAAYGLAFVAISVLLPGRRVVRMQRNVAPDILLDRTPGALRGVEVAGRTTGGLVALRVAKQEFISSFPPPKEPQGLQGASTAACPWHAREKQRSRPGDMLAGATRSARRDPVQLLAKSVLQTLERPPIAA